MIDISVPETVTTPFVVATAQPPHDPAQVARARTRHPLAADLLRTPLVRVRTLPAGESGYADLIEGAAWARPEDRRLLPKLTHHVVVMGHIPPVSQPDHGQATRAIARVVAEACEGVVYDAWSHQVLPHDFRYGAEHPEFCLADEWLATFISGGDSTGGLHLTTAGLHRFALPELEARKVPLGNVFAAVTLLRCLAVTLLHEHWDWLACNPGARSRRLQRHAWVEGRDVWRYWAAEPRETSGGRVRVRLVRSPQDGPQTLPYVAVGPPADFAAPVREWWNDVVDLAMPYVPEAPRRTAA
ncbi:hypothetical protein [Actinomadura sp. DC4]|uniref:hypothetical protein n=1 Tax=Actinomadura sp. DC4 TaxID=3055069 RepID=UPI0025B00AF4|nr:hypothetical protein [Actinomadura sp. DC4]MDN3352674.1 hypothetical protein [Actinomadura sp. DC4]